MKTPRIPIALQQAVMRSLRENLAKANLKLGRHYPEPVLVYQQRGTSAGTAWLEKNEIRLNPVLLLENQQAFIDEVVPHELAHLLVWKHFGRVAPHGKEWKWMMESVLGVPARAPIVSNSIQCAKYLPLPLPVPAAPAYRPPPQSRDAREATYRCVRCGDVLVAEK
jgi:SprT protein